MPITLPRAARDEAIRSIERLFADALDQRTGNIAAGALPGFFLQEIAPLAYNQTVAAVQERLLARVQEIDLEFHEDAFTHWRQREQPPRHPRCVPEMRA